MHFLYENALDLFTVGQNQSKPNEILDSQRGEERDT